MAVSRRINTGDGLVLASCQASDAVGDCVYVTANIAGERVQVTKTDPRDLTKGPAIGVIQVKSSPTQCVVQIAGVLIGAYSGLTPNALLFVGLDGRLQATTTGITAIPGDKVFVQQMGQALGFDRVMIVPQAPIVRIA